MSYFRPEIDAMEGYVPGEQPSMPNLIKLNTNENPYPPSPRVKAVLMGFDPARLRRYPKPAADALRIEIAKLHGVNCENVIVGNGSDDILTMVFRAFTAPNLPLACLYPTYSLYFELAKMQGASVIRVGLNPNDFSLPGDLLEQVASANLLIITRPNAPTGNSFNRDLVYNICREFKGIVFIDEAYADFADDNCMDFATQFENVIVSRSFSKSYALAGLRLGYAVGHPVLINGLFKLKDSYNLDMLTQEIGLVAFTDHAYHADRCREVRETRAVIDAELRKLGFHVVPSQANFLFASPPDENGENCFRSLRERAIIVRYFPGEVTGRYVRITLGTPSEMNQLLATLRLIYGK